MHVVVIGANGKVARLLGPMLDQQGHRVTGIIRNPSHADDVTGAAMHPVVADVETLSTEQMTELFAGNDAVVWSAGAGGGNPVRTRAVDRDAAIRSMDAAAAAGVDRYVMVSFFGSRVDHGVPADSGFFPYAEAKAAADEYLRGTTLAWTVLGPSGLTNDPGLGTIAVDEADGGQVPRADVAAVVVATLAEPETIGQTITFNTGTTPVAEALRATS
ncbi:MAG TPA: SDR family oxidoreductase [Acidimicrobiales bacterium]|nr:SDR family oxidoreductase [Acidimicrobiales bacterium]